MSFNCAGGFDSDVSMWIKFTREDEAKQAYEVWKSAVNEGFVFFVGSESMCGRGGQSITALLPVSLRVIFMYNGIDR